MLARLTLHATFALIWSLSVMVLWPFPYLMMNDVAWQQGFGERLVEPPVAGFHHRIMGTIKGHERNQKVISRLEGHLNGYPDATAEQRQEWQTNLDAARSDRNTVWILSVAIALATYSLAAIAFNRWVWSGDDRFIVQQQGASL